MYLISIIVPVYNVEDYLCKCIESLINQTLKDIEIILVNDGSTDTSPQICDRYAKKDKRIKVIHKENGGLSDARNTGISVANGKFIAFLDSDDWVNLEMYEKLYSYACVNDADIVQCDFMKVYNEENFSCNNIDTKTELHTGIQALNHLHGNRHGKTVVVWNKIYKKELFRDIRFPKGRIHEDEFIMYKILHKSNKIIDTNLPMVYYRQRNGSIMNSEFNIKRLDILDAWKERIDFFEDNKLVELKEITESRLCSKLKSMYSELSKSNIKNKDKILKCIKRYMITDYSKFIKNSYITNKGKVALTVCIVNGRLFCKIYESHINR